MTEFISILGNRVITCLDYFEDFGEEIKEDEIGTCRTCEMHTKSLSHNLWEADYFGDLGRDRRVILKQIYE